MKKFFKIIGIILLIMLLLVGAAYFYYDRLEAGYQREADAKRKADVIKIADLLEGYKNKMGRYPFYDPFPAPEGHVKVPTLIMIGMPSAEEELTNKPNPFGTSVSRCFSNCLIENLKLVLKRDISLPVDPQKIPTFAPNLYFVFIFRDDTYLVLTNLWC